MHCISFDHSVDMLHQFVSSSLKCWGFGFFVDFYLVVLLRFGSADFCFYCAFGKSKCWILYSFKFWEFQFEITLKDVHASHNFLICVFSACI